MTMRQPFGRLPTILIVAGIVLLTGTIIWGRTASGIRYAMEVIKTTGTEKAEPPPSIIEIEPGERRTEVVRFQEKKKFHCYGYRPTISTGTPRRRDGSTGCVLVHYFSADITDCGVLETHITNNVPYVTLEGIERGEVWVQVSCS